MERMIPKKSHSTKTICSFCVLNKGRRSINRMTSANSFCDSKEYEKYCRPWKMDMNNKATVWEVLIVFVFIYLYLSNPPSSPYNAINTFGGILSYLANLRESYPHPWLEYGGSHLWYLKWISKLKWEFVSGILPATPFYVCMYICLYACMFISLWK